MEKILLTLSTRNFKILTRPLQFMIEFEFICLFDMTKSKALKDTLNYPTILY